MTTITQTHYPKIEVAHSEKDVLQLWQYGEHDSNVIMIEYEKIDEVVALLKQLKNDKIKSVK